MVADEVDVCAMEFASASGADSTACVRSIAVNAVMDSMTPSREKVFRSRSSAGDSLLRRVIAHAERRTDFTQALVLEKSQQQRGAVAFAERVHRVVEQRLDLSPCGISLRWFHTRDLLFVFDAARLHLARVGSGETCRAIQPCRENRFVVQRLGFAGEDDERGLRDFLRRRGVAHLPPRRGIDEVDVTLHEGGERFVRVFLCVASQQLDVRRLFHHLIMDGRKEIRQPMPTTFRKCCGSQSRAAELTPTLRESLRHAHR
jgi:hypothetical protein